MFLMNWYFYRMFTWLPSWLKINSSSLAALFSRWEVQPPIMPDKAWKETRYILNTIKFGREKHLGKSTQNPQRHPKPLWRSYKLRIFNDFFDLSMRVWLGAVGCTFNKYTQMQILVFIIQQKYRKDINLFNCKSSTST